MYQYGANCFSGTCHWFIDRTIPLTPFIATASGAAFIYGKKYGTAIAAHLNFLAFQSTGEKVATDTAKWLGLGETITSIAAKIGWGIGHAATPLSNDKIAPEVSAWMGLGASCLTSFTLNLIAMYVFKIKPLKEQLKPPAEEKKPLQEAINALKEEMKILKEEKKPAGEANVLIPPQPSKPDLLQTLKTNRASTTLPLNSKVPSDPRAAELLLKTKTAAIPQKKWEKKPDLIEKQKEQEAEKSFIDNMEETISIIPENETIYNFEKEEKDDPFFSKECFWNLCT